MTQEWIEQLCQPLNTGHPGILRIPHLSVILSSKDNDVSRTEKTTTYVTLPISSPCLPCANFWSRNPLEHPDSKLDVWGEFVQEKLYFLLASRHAFMASACIEQKTKHANNTWDNTQQCNTMCIYIGDSRCMLSHHECDYDPILCNCLVAAAPAKRSNQPPANLHALCLDLPRSHGKCVVRGPPCSVHCWMLNRPTRTHPISCPLTSQLLHCRNSTGA